MSFWHDGFLLMWSLRIVRGSRQSWTAVSSVLKANLATDVTIAVIASIGDLLMWVAIGRTPASGRIASELPLRIGNDEIVAEPPVAVLQAGDGCIDLGQRKAAMLKNREIERACTRHFGHVLALRRR